MASIFRRFGSEIPDTRPDFQLQLNYKALERVRVRARKLKYVPVRSVFRARTSEGISMNTNLLIAGLLVFSCLPAFAIGERPDLVVVDRAQLATIQLEKLIALQQAGILVMKDDLISVNIETLRELIEQFRN